jgi:hypothetical protein
MVWISRRFASVVGRVVAATDIVPISQGQLKAFMYENFGKGRQAEQERILGLLDDLFRSAPMRGDVALSDLRRLIVGSQND